MVSSLFVFKESLMAKVLFMHSDGGPTPRQIEALKRLYGDDVEIIHDAYYNRELDVLINRIYETKCDDIVLVAPFTVIKLLCERGIYPLFAVMKKTTADKAELTRFGKHIMFSHYVRVKAIRMEHIEPERNGLHGSV